MRSNWLKFTTEAKQEKSQPRIEKYGNIVECYMADSRAIRGKIFQDQKSGLFLKATSKEPAVAARNIVRPKQTDNVLLVCEKDGITEGTFKVLDNCLDNIYITHPDPAEAEKYANRFRSMGYKSTIEVVSFDSAFTEDIKDFHAIFNCQPMDNGAKDAAMIEAWSNNTNKAAKLVHLKGVPQQRNTTSASWNTAAANNVIFVEDLQRQQEQDNEHNAKIIAHAETAITNSATSRRLGRRPVDSVNKSTGKTHLLDSPPEYEALVSTAAAAAERFKNPPSSGIA